jgi:hypothetical protein
MGWLLNGLAAIGAIIGGIVLLWALLSMTLTLSRIEDKLTQIQADLKKILETKS